MTGLLKIASKDNNAIRMATLYLPVAVKFEEVVYDLGAVHGTVYGAIFTRYSSAPDRFLCWNDTAPDNWIHPDFSYCTSQLVLQDLKSFAMLKIMHDTAFRKVYIEITDENRTFLAESAYELMMVRQQALRDTIGDAVDRMEAMMAGWIGI